MCAPTVYSQTHRCGVVCFSQVLSGAHRAPVWVTAYLGAEAGGMASEGRASRANPGWVLGVLHSVVLIPSVWGLVSPSEKWCASSQVLNAPYLSGKSMRESQARGGCVLLGTGVADPW